MVDEQRPEEVQHSTTKRRAALVVSLLKGETRTAEAARRRELQVAEVEEWRAGFLLRAENAHRRRQKEDKALRKEEIKRIRRKVAELRTDLDILCDAARRPTTPGHPTSDGDVSWGVDAQTV
jgi:hypothetical protein